MLLCILTHFFQCSNRHCRYTLFHTEPLEPDVAHTLIFAAKSNPTLLLNISSGFFSTMDTPSNSFPNSHSFQPPLATTQPVNISLSQYSPSPAPTPPMATASTIWNTSIPLSHPDQVAGLAKDGGGIYCANTTCSTVGRGTRAPGHKGCSSLMCKKCCQQQAENALRNNIPIPGCRERRHKLNQTPTHHTNVPQVPTAFTPGPSHVTPAFPQIFPTSSLSSTPGLDTAAPAALHSANYAEPLTDMWREVTGTWLNEQRTAAKAYDQRTSNKKTILEKQQTKQRQITTISYLTVSVIIA